jgi:hypothetical protein
MTSEGNPSQQSEPTADALPVQAEDGVLASETPQLEVLTYPEELLNFARKLIDDGQFSIAVVVCHIACEIATEHTLVESFAKKGIQYLQEPVLGLFSGYSLRNERLRQLYTALTGDQIQGESFWTKFDDSAKRRNCIVHGKLVVGKVEAEDSFKAAQDFVAHVKK